MNLRFIITFYLQEINSKHFGKYKYRNSINFPRCLPSPKRSVSAITKKRWSGNKVTNRHSIMLNSSMVPYVRTFMKFTKFSEKLSLFISTVLYTRLTHTSYSKKRRTTEILKQMEAMSLLLLFTILIRCCIRNFHLFCPAFIFIHHK